MSASSPIVDIPIPYGWEPRDYQNDAWKALHRGYRRAVLVWHRRAGKDSLSLNWTIAEALETPGVYWHLLPTAKQARKVIWEGQTKEGRRFMDFWPPQSIVKARADEMALWLTSGSMWQLAGFDNYDSLVGSNPIGVVLSEFAVSDRAREAWNYIRPILAENGGWALFAYTPRGENHGFDLYTMAQSNPDWYAQLLTVDDTKALPEEAIDDERRAGMPPEMIQQEFYCSFTAPLVGAYYGHEMAQAERDGRICGVPHDPAVNVETWWDLGIDDETSIWFVQRVGREIHLIDYYHNAGQSLAHYASILATKRDERRYVYGDHVFPHDGGARELGSGKTRQETMASLGFVPIVQDRHELMDGINAARNLISACWFDKERCADGIRALRSYRREFDEQRETHKERPVHDWACLVGDTRVWTRSGMRQIMDLPETGEIMTLCGWRQYHSPHCTRKNAPLVAVTFKDGLTVKCTPDHLFLTASGWKYASDLQTDTQILSSWTRSRSISTALCTAFIRATDIFQEVARAFTETLGGWHSALFPKGAIFTTATATGATMPSQILSASRQANTFHSPGEITNQESVSTSQTRPVLGPLNGTAPKKGAFGTAATQDGLKAGKSGSASRASVNGAARTLWRWFANRGILNAIAPATAKPRIIASVKALDERADVWCLTVPSNGTFCLPNGAVVHNSHGADAFRYGAMHRPPLKTRAPLVYPSHHVSHGVV